MHILIISQYFYPENFKINDYAIGLVERGHDVTVLTGYPNYPHGSYFNGYSIFSIGTEYYKGIKIVRVPIILRGKNSKIRLILNYISYVFSASLLGIVLCREKYDVSFVFEPSPVTVMLPAIFFKWTRDIPILFWVQDLWPESIAATGAFKSRRLLVAIRKLVDYIYKRSDLILVQSKGFVSHVLSSGVSEEKIKYLPNWTEDFYYPETLNLKLLVEQDIPDGFRVMFAGNIGVAQDFDTVLNAAEKLKGIINVQWLILGDGKQRVWLENEIVRRKLDNNFNLLGSKPATDMPKYFSMADVLLVTLRDEEIFSYTIPCKLQSYLACGRPIVAALSGYGADILNESGAGIAANAGDATGLANAILKIFNLSESERKQLGYNAYQYSKKKFDRNTLIDSTVDWIKEVVS